MVNLGKKDGAPLLQGKSSLLNKVLFGVFFLSVAVIVANNYYQYAILKNYDMYIEVQCDFSTESGCIRRDCNEEECPPNELESYKIYKIKAKDLAFCQDGTCYEECANMIISCEAQALEE